VNSGRVTGFRSRDEIANAIRSFTPADLARLKLVAKKYSYGRPIDPEDLLQEACLRALDSRTCPADVDVVKFLAEAVRSIAHGEADKAEHRAITVSIDGSDKSNDDAFEIEDDSDSAETKMIAAERAQRCVAIHAEIVALFNDDPVAKLVLEGAMDDLTVEEMCGLTGLDKTAYASKRKLIRRRIDKQYPEGWKP
jgi:DNA-directed RNA polymerase specialized sigma24 family protein